MDDYKYLQELESIAPDNPFCHYIAQRVVSDDYRGIHCSQHNRLTFDDFAKYISAIYSVAGSEVFDIHVGDDKGEKQPQAHTYYKVVDEIKKAAGKGTINSVKKNTFPDIAKMGFLDRYDSHGLKISEGVSRATVCSVGLSERGVKFVGETVFGKIKLFTDGVDTLTKNAASQLAELLYLNDYGVDYISLLEFMYIVSDDSTGKTTSDKLRLLLDYRKLTPPQKAKVTDCLKRFCDPKNRKAYNNKLLLRDYSNWKNESQQIYGLLTNSTYFKVEGTGDNKKLILNTGSTGLFAAHANRGEKAKNEYFKYHHVGKTGGYELHHIIPFSKAQNQNDALYVDDYKNLIYLTAQKHAKFTAENNKNVIMKYAQGEPNIVFMDFDDGYILVDITKDALVSPALLPQIKEYNQQLLKKFYYV